MHCANSTVLGLDSDAPEARPASGRREIAWGSHGEARIAASQISAGPECHAGPVIASLSPLDTGLVENQLDNPKTAV